MSHQIIDSIQHHLSVVNDVFSFSKSQRAIHDNILRATMKLTQKEPVDDEQPRLINAPRRIGSSFSIGVMSAVLFWCVPNIHIVCCSHDSKLKENIELVLHKAFNYSTCGGDIKRVFGENDERSIFIHTDGSARGMSGNLVFLDKHDDIVMRDFMVPILSATNTCLVTISSTKEEPADTIFSRMIQSGAFNNIRGKL